MANALITNDTLTQAVQVATSDVRPVILCTLDPGTGNVSVGGSSGSVPAQVQDLAVHPGEDATYDRTWGGPKATSKIALTGNGVIKAAAGYFYGYIVTTVTATAAIQVFDNASTNSGTVIDTIATATAVGHYVLPTPVPCTNGMFAQFGTATGTVLFLFI
jgi:hypothetical protein